MEDIVIKDKTNAWSGFKGETWKNEINVSDFIDNNYKEYRGDDSFLSPKSKKTGKVWAKCEKLLAIERKKHLLDVDLKHISGINNFPAGYIDKANEVIVGLQADKPLKRIINPFGGIRMAKNALAAYNKKMDAKHTTMVFLTPTLLILEKQEGLGLLLDFLMLMEEEELLATIDV